MIPRPSPVGRPQQTGTEVPFCPSSLVPLLLVNSQSGACGPWMDIGSAVESLSPYCVLMCIYVYLSEEKRIRISKRGTCSEST